MLIHVYCGESVEYECEHQKHPVNEVKRAKEIIDSIIESKKSVYCHSNSPDFVSAIKYLSEKHSIESKFFLNGECFDSDIEPIFEDFNKSFTLLDALI